jgi:hypothetical protein
MGAIAHDNRTPAVTKTARSEPARSVSAYTIGANESCDHPSERRVYLGHYGAAAFYRCEACEAIIVYPPQDS